MAGNAAADGSTKSDTHGGVTELACRTEVLGTRARDIEVLNNRFRAALDSLP
ncbi:MAG: hypothetical protein V7634_5017, partial [Bradyrhizobium sp.]